MTVKDPGVIAVRGARQNNLRNLDIDLPLGELVVVTGVSGSGKSSLVFDTLYAEGQRRYVETFSPYARQFLDRMDKPQVDRIDGIPPAIAIDQTNPVRTSRSTVGTMTEINDHLKLLFARTGALFCRGCAQPVRRDTAETVYAGLAAHAGLHEDPMAHICFPIPVPRNFKEAEIRDLLAKQGYTRIREPETQPKAKAKAKAKAKEEVLEVIQDRTRIASADRSRVMESIEGALRMGHGRVAVYFDGDSGAHRYSSDLHCPRCDIAYREPTPSAFSFNSPLGACDTCRGFGRVIGVDYGLVIPDPSKTLLAGAIKPFQSESYSECQDDLEKYAKRKGVALDVPWRDLPPEHREWVIAGDGGWNQKVWYGVKRFFAWLESRAYKMHIRVLLSRYRSYTPCETCDGARLKTDSLLWRIGDHSLASEALAGREKFLPRGVSWKREQLNALPGLSVHDVMPLPVDRVQRFFAKLTLPAPLDAATELLLGEVRTRFAYLNDVGLGYLTLDRQSRTLSGGEVQRINLTTALGTSLVNTLFVLDEPSIGLHPRDMGRVIAVMHRLRDSGNSLVVVEHDPQIMVEADRILDIGPGAGERGGEIVFFGTPQALRGSKQSLTGDYLAGRRTVAEPSTTVPTADAGEIVLRGAREHNLKHVDFNLPLNRFVCLAGVSGSGKSTLVEDVLHPALQKALGKPAEMPGAFDTLRGAERISDVVMVDQAPIGRTTRSTPASYVGAFDPIRDLFSATHEAVARGYTSGTFSFNSGTGRCPVCSGNGFEHIEMQFLSDVYLRCAECDGQRFRAEVLEVRIDGADGRRANVADVLAMTVTEALSFFAKAPKVLPLLAPLEKVGLEYVRLGQPVPTLSGGEAQRLKLAGHLAASDTGPATDGRGKLFLFDEPTTGLHFDDVAKLLRALRELVARGHSLLVIEHNLDVLRAADWIVELGPEGGDGGGELVFAGSPKTLTSERRTHTGRALADYAATLGAPIAVARVADAPRRRVDDSVVIHNAREHNLKNVDVRIPRDRFTVITGVSGSGKSTLAFDILFNEGQRRYLESLNAYARQFVQPAARPDVDAIYGIPPTVAIEQRTSRGGRKSTVATLTEIYHFLRLLYVKLGTQFCPTCETAIEPQSLAAISARVLKDYRGKRIRVLAPLVVARKGYYTDLAKWASKKGYAALRVDGADVPTKNWPRLSRFKEHTIELPVAEIDVKAANDGAVHTALASAVDFGKGVVHVVTADAAKGAAVAVYSIKRACPTCGTSFAELDPRLLSFNSPHGWCTACQGTGVEPDEDAADEKDNDRRERKLEETDTGDGERPVCAECDGERLNLVARHVRFRDQSIMALTAEPVNSAADFFEKLKLKEREAAIARDLLAEIRSRLGFLDRVGLGYLALDRAAPTLSGGEAQRIRLAAQLGSNLRGVCYVLDEPTIGLHPRDNRILLDALAELAAHKNTLVVVEHDEDTILRADHVIDLGPGAGVRGGHVVAAGTAAELMASPDSVTGRYLRHPIRHAVRPRRATDANTPSVLVEGATLHNLKNVDARFPVGRLSVVTGVSGSGKSTLARDVLFASLAGENPVGCKRIRGRESIDRVLEVDQTPIGKTPRSCPATYVGIWDAIRKLFAGTTEAKIRGYTASRFSFNTAGGRCEDCAGQGVQTVEMSFLPDVKLTCDVCGGRRFNAETLSVTWRERSIGDVLAMSIEDAVDFFRAHPAVHHPLALLAEVGLGYLTLGQPSPTLSGGEAQRLKLVSELAKVKPEVGARLRAKPMHTLYVLDEPTVGLHMADVEKLIHALHRLTEAGNSIVVVEHNLDVMAEADWIVDMGPEAGGGGGRVVAQGAPFEILKRKARSHTAAALAEFLKDRTKEAA